MTYIVFDSRLRRSIITFNTKRACTKWLKEGLYGCDGAERDHYANMLEQLDCGKTTLDYWEDC